MSSKLITEGKKEKLQNRHPKFLFLVVDRGLAMLVQAGWRDAMITAGGDLRTVASPLTAGRRYIWIQHPRAAHSNSTENKTGNFFGRFKLDAGAVSTSGDYERFSKMASDTSAQEQIESFLH